MPKQIATDSAGTSELSPTTESEEMYLITVARALEAGHSEPVPMPEIAEAMSVSVTSANEMVRKLAGRDLVTYEPYRGAGLTRSGRAVANRVLRTRRLWATFLVEHLGLAPIEADDQACHLEHVTSPDAVERLATFLGDPAVDPLGQPIPSLESPHTVPGPRTIPLDQAPTGIECEVVAIRASGAAREFLTGSGITPGGSLMILASGESGVLADAGVGAVHLIRRLATAVDVLVGGG